MSGGPPDSSAEASAAPKKASPRSIYLRAGVFVLFLAGVVALRWTPVMEYLDEQRLLDLFADLRQTWWAPVGLIALHVVLATTGLPVSPAILVGGAVFGFMHGWIYNTIGLLLGGTTGFYLAKFLGRDFVVHIVGNKLEGVERLLEQHGFWPLVQTRFMPIPYAMVNYGAALAGVRPGKFLLALAVGIIPAASIHTYFIAALLEQSGQRLVVLAQYIAVLLIFNVLISIPQIRLWWRTRRAKSTGEGE